MFFVLMFDVLCCIILCSNNHIITGHVLTCDFKTTIFKTDLRDHFPIVIAPKNDGPSQQLSKAKHQYKRSYNEENIKASINDYFLSIGMKLKTAIIPMSLINSF